MPEAEAPEKSRMQDVSEQRGWILFLIAGSKGELHKVAILEMPQKLAKKILPKCEDKMCDLV